jgi:hypothetical protein
VSDPRPTSHLDDERLSAMVDGEATPGDEQHVRVCAECAASLVAWRQALEDLAAPVRLVDAARRDAAIDAALLAAAAADDATDTRSAAAGTAATPSAAAGGPTADAEGSAVAPVSLADHRRRRSGLVGSRVAAAVAAVIVIAGVGIGVWQAGGGGSSHPSAVSSAASNVPAASLPGGSASGGATAPSQQPTSALRVPAAGTSSASLYLGSYQDSGAVVAALRDRMAPANTGVQASPPQPAKAPPIESAPLSPCLSQAAADARVPAGTTPVLVATLIYRNSPAQVYVFEAGHAHTAAVVGGAGCQLLARASF